MKWGTKDESMLSKRRRLCPESLKGICSHPNRQKEPARICKSCPLHQQTKHKHSKLGKRIMKQEQRKLAEKYLQYKKKVSKKKLTPHLKKLRQYLPSDRRV
jgi:hypoxanthine phosphoribosyltransferase